MAFSKSFNGGSTWEAVPLVQQFNENSFRIMDFIAVSENVAYIGASYMANINKGRLYKTVDGGLTWNSVKDFDTIINYVHFWNSNEGIVVCHPNMQSWGSQKIEVYKNK